MSVTSDVLDNFQYFLNLIKNIEISVLPHQPNVSDDFQHFSKKKTTTKKQLSSSSQHIIISDFRMVIDVSDNF